MFSGVDLDDVVHVEVIQLNTRGDGLLSVVTDFTLRLHSSNRGSVDWDAYQRGHEPTVATFPAFMKSLNAALDR